MSFVMVRIISAGCSAVGVIDIFPVVYHCLNRRLNVFLFFSVIVKMQLSFVNSTCIRIYCFELSTLCYSLMLHVCNAFQIILDSIWRTVAGSVSGPATFFLEIGHKIFNGHSLPNADSSKTVVSYWRKHVHLVLVNRLGSLPRNSVVRLTERLDMSTVVDWDVKPQIKQTNNVFLNFFWVMLIIVNSLYTTKAKIAQSASPFVQNDLLFKKHVKKKISCLFLASNHYIETSQNGSITKGC